MTTVPFTHCCHLLAVDAKTLRQWLKQSQLSLQAHPLDGRVKCLTSEQVHLLANLHGRVLQDSAEPAAASQKQSEIANVLFPPDADLREKLAQMEVQVATLQAQLSHLTFQLLQERELRTEQRLLAPQAQFTPIGEPPLTPLASSAPTPQSQPATPLFACHPTEKRTSLLPLIAYATGGRYVLISPQEGELPITADSPEWFAWLASLSSFRFVGQSGRFSARRGYNRCPNRGWYAQRTIHQQSHSKYIGVSEHVTTARLEQIAAHFQSYMK
jgi:hypothetical protein